jgi:hypothetical protein
MNSTFRRLWSPLGIAVSLILLAVTPAAAHPRAQFPVQSSGDRGTDVVALQHLLRAQGRNILVTGFFNTETHDAVTAFQQQQGLGASGVANVATWEALVPTIQLGSSSEAVLALKKQLNAKRKAGLAVSSSFDGATRDAVRTFQKHIGLSGSGVVDRSTWRNLIWHFMRPDFSRVSLCNYNGGSGNGDWGTAAAVAHLQSAADLFHARTGGRVAIGDLSLEHGGDITLHSTHEDGLDIDMSPIRHDGRQCNNPGAHFNSGQYDRAGTRRLLQAFHDALGPHLQLIYWNDPQLIAEGLSRRFPNHDSHIHVRICERDHAKAIYVC